MTTVRSPTSTLPSSAVSTAPKRIRAPAPTCTSPHKTAFGATYADGSTVGLAPRCSINMLRIFPAPTRPNGADARTTRTGISFKAADAEAEAPVAPTPERRIHFDGSVPSGRDMAHPQEAHGSTVVGH